MRALLTVISLSCIFFNQAAYATNISLRDKIGQMLIVGFDGKTVNKNAPIAQQIDQENIGGVILFDLNLQTKTYDKNIESPEQVRTLNTHLQALAKKSNQTLNRPDLPLLISVDYEGGKVTRLHERYGFPATVSAKKAAQETSAEAQKIAEKMAITLDNAAFNLNFSPVLDIDANADNPIIAQKERAFSSDPKKTSAYAALYSEAFLNHGVQCAYKHFPGHGSATGDSHLGFVDVSNTWKAFELDAFKSSFNQPMHCGMVMTAHIVNQQLDRSGLPATLSHEILTNILRKKLAFDGVIITDDMQMKAISAHYGLEEALTLAIHAGADMFIFGNQLTDKPQTPKEIIDIIEAKVKSGEISESRINNAYQHIVQFKHTI